MQAPQQSPQQAPQQPPAFRSISAQTNRVPQGYANPAGPSNQNSPAGVNPDVYKWITDNNPGASNVHTGDQNTYMGGQKGSGVSFSSPDGSSTVMNNQVPFYGVGGQTVAMPNNSVYDTHGYQSNSANLAMQSALNAAAGNMDTGSQEYSALAQKFNNDPAYKLAANGGTYNDYVHNNSDGTASTPGAQHGVFVNADGTYYSPQGNSGGGGQAYNGNPGQSGSSGQEPNLSNMGDAEYQNALSRLASDRGQANVQYATGTNDVNTQAYQAQRDINQQAPLNYEALLNKFASHGMAHSGRYAQDYGTAQNDTAKQLYEVNNQKNNQLNSLLQQLTGANQQYSNGEMDANSALTRRLAQNAGKLGLDKTTKDPVAPRLNSGQAGGLNRPLPPRSAAVDKSITSIPSSKWSDRQVAYAAKYNLKGKR